MYTIKSFYVEKNNKDQNFRKISCVLVGPDTLLLEVIRVAFPKFGNLKFEVLIFLL